MTPISRILAAAALGLALASCGNPAAPQGNYGTIFGVVKSTSGQPVAGAVVTADTVISSAPTGPDGKYTIQTVPVDSPTTTTSVTCAAQGYQTPPGQSVTVVSGKQIEADFTLKPQ
jgi:hypothetical protein